MVTGDHTPLVRHCSDPALVSFLDQGPPDMGTLWEICSFFEWDRDITLKGIASWLGPAAGLRVLDCGCGSGFPAIGLARLGFEVSCSDGSPMMLEHFRRSAGQAGVTLEPECVGWDELSAHYGTGSFDVVMCRGGGAVLYAGTWDAELPPDRQAVENAINEFARCIRPGGRLYIDMILEKNLACVEAQRTAHPRLVAGDHLVELEELIINDPAHRVRCWRSRLMIDDSEYTFERRSHYLTQAEFAGLLTRAGLVGVRKEIVEGESYDVFVADHR